MARQPQAPSGAARGNKAQAVVAIAASVLILVFALILFILYLHWNGDLSAFRSAPPCSSPAGAMGSSGTCRYDGPATIVATNRTAQLHVTVGFESASDRTLTATFFTNDEPTPEQLATGATATAQVWKGAVTALAGHGTVDSPENPPTTQAGQAAPGFAVAGLVLLFLASMMARSAWRAQPA